MNNPIDVIKGINDDITKLKFYELAVLFHSLKISLNRFQNKLFQGI